MPQTYVTTTSLLLVTAFRAALTATIGLSYTQYLWKSLRSYHLKVGFIEELFQIRNNPLRLLNRSVLQHAPTLLAVAIFTWLVPIAMIYPPGALVVSVDSWNYAEKFNVSVIQPNHTYSQSRNVSKIWYNGLAEFVGLKGDRSSSCTSSDNCNYKYLYVLHQSSPKVIFD